MKKQIILTQDDIQQIIANSFNVDKDKVNFEKYEDIECSVLGLSYVHVDKVKATVEVPMNEQR